MTGRQGPLCGFALVDARERPEMTTAGTGTHHRAAKVVVGVDGSATSQAALRWALEQAHRLGARVQAVTVWSPPAAAGGSVACAIMASEAAVDDDACWAEARHRLDTALSEIPAIDEQAAGLIDPVVVFGEAAAALLDAAQDAQLLVVGNPGRGALAAAVVGSVALQCIQHARCPIVLVPDPSPPPTAG
jgi:nucleotide-binding universal stress UspA family protein